jgi:hypothetical protein
VAPREDELKSEIERTKEQLAGHLTDLKREAAATQRKVMLAAGLLLGIYVAYRVVRFFVRRYR